MNIDPDILDWLSNQIQNLIRLKKMLYIKFPRAYDTFWQFADPVTVQQQDWHNLRSP